MGTVGIALRASISWLSLLERFPRPWPWLASVTLTFAT